MATKRESKTELSGPTPLRPVESYDRPNGLNIRDRATGSTLETSGKSAEVRKGRHPYVVGALAGVLGAALMTLVSLVLQLGGVSELSLELLLGTFLTGSVDAGTWVMGFVWHLANGALFGLFYTAAFRAWKRSGALFGAGLGAVHWVFGGILIGLGSALNPYVPALLSPIGFFATINGIGQAILFFCLHLFFGAVVGAAYRASAAILTPSIEEPSGEEAKERDRKAA